MAPDDFFNGLLARARRALATWRAALGARARALALRAAPGLWLRFGPHPSGWSPAAVGRFGEALVARGLAARALPAGCAGGRAAGRAGRARLRLLGRRVVTPAAEVDLVFLAGGELVLCEVKTARLPRSRGAPAADFGPAGRNLRREQVARLEAAGRFLARRTGAARVRLALAEVWVDAAGRRAGWTLAEVERSATPRLGSGALWR